MSERTKGREINGETQKREKKKDREEERERLD